MEGIPIMSLPPLLHDPTPGNEWARRGPGDGVGDEDGHPEQRPEDYPSRHAA